MVKALREVISLSDLSEEEKLKLQTNLAKGSAAPEQHRGFVQAMKSAGLSGSLMVKDSLVERTEVKSELVEEVEATEEVVEDEIVEEVKSEEVVETESEVVVEPVVAEAEKTTAEPTVQQSVITPEILKEFLAESIKSAVQPLQTELEKAQSTIASQKQALADKDAAIAAGEESQDILKGLGQLLGRSETPTEKKSKSMEMPNINRVTSISDKIEGRLAEFMEVRDASGVQYRQTPKGLVPMYQTRNIDNWMSELRSNKREFHKFLEEDLTNFGKAHGLFRGNRMITEGERRAATTASNIPGGFLEVLSAIMRTNARPGLVFWQFPTTVHQFEKGEGDTIVIPRSAYPAAATDSNERLLSGGGTYVSIDSSNQNVQTGLIRFSLNEYGRGRSEAPPIAIPTFVESYSMLPLLTLLQRDLFYDYYRWEDLVIREQWRPTSRVFYNNGDEIATTAAGVLSNGQMTRKFLGAVYTQMANEQVIPLADGNYGLVTNPTAIRQLKNSLDQYWQAPTAEEIQDLTNILLMDYPNGENLKIQGYKGLYEGFHIFETNGFANGGNGTEGVLNESCNSGGTVTTGTFRTSYAFGYAASGRALGGTGVQILFDEKTDFGRLDRAIWQSYEGHGPLDVDATGYGESGANAQETRVFRVATCDQLID
jgi:hypothetical protein